MSPSDELSHGKLLRGRRLAWARKGLADCPKCGRKKEYIDVYKEGLVFPIYCAQCDKCGRAISGTSVDTMTKGWNYRSNPGAKV